MYPAAQHDMGNVFPEDETTPKGAKQRKGKISTTSM